MLRSKADLVNAHMKYVAAVPKFPVTACKPTAREHETAKNAQTSTTTVKSQTVTGEGQ